MSDELSDELRMRRGIDRHADLCGVCGGWGRRLYGSTATWRGGVGGAAMTWDVCDVCWGSGTPQHPGENLREWRDRLRQAHTLGSARMFAESIGAQLGVMRPTVEALSKELRKMSRQRRPRPYWWADSCERLADLLEEAIPGTIPGPDPEAGDPQ